MRIIFFTFGILIVYYFLTMFKVISWKRAFLDASVVLIIYTLFELFKAL